jgi:hypothetical protein
VNTTAETERDRAKRDRHHPFFNVSVEQATAAVSGRAGRRRANVQC